jgi:transcriptional regulator with XRE-family HTH domain
MQKPQRETFDGRITPLVSHRLRSRRLALAMSYEELGLMLGVSWSTIRKWELGECARCTPPLQDILALFLAGDYDEQLLRRVALRGKRIRNPSFAVSRQRRQRIEQLCQLGERHPEALINVEQALIAAAALALRHSLGGASEQS